MEIGADDIFVGYSFIAGFSGISQAEKNFPKGGVISDIGSPTVIFKYFERFDIVLLGGGSDREQELVCQYLKKVRKDFKDYVEEDGVVLAVCGGYQLLGNYYKTSSKTIFAVLLTKRLSDKVRNN